MFPVQSLIVMGLEVSIDTSAEQIADALLSDAERTESTRARERDEALLALVERFGFEGVLEGLQFAAEQAADAHDGQARLRDTVRELRAVARSIANAVTSSKAVRS